MLGIVGIMSVFCFLFIFSCIPNAGFVLDTDKEYVDVTPFLCWTCLSLSSFKTQSGVVDLPIFSFFMGNIDTDTPTGVLTLGGVNQTHYEGN